MDLVKLYSKAATAQKHKWSPSSLKAWKWCPRNWNWLQNEQVEMVRQLPYLMIFGGMYHAVAQGIDAKTGWLELLDDYHERTRLSESYKIAGHRDKTVLDHCRAEVMHEVVPKYAKFISVSNPNIAVSPADCKTLMVEQLIEVEYDDFILKCIPDKVIETDGKLWVVERKSTSRDDSAWLRQWTMDLQTTAEVMCVEAALGRPVEGALIEQFVVTRKRAKNWDLPWPQPIHSATFHPWRPVPKSKHIKDTALQFVADCTQELHWRRFHKHQLNAINPNNCNSCDFQPVCSGKADPETCLAPRSPYDPGEPLRVRV